MIGVVPSVKKVVFRAFRAENRPSTERLEHGDRLVLAFHLRCTRVIFNVVPAQEFCVDELLVFPAQQLFHVICACRNKNNIFGNERNRE